MIKDSGSLFLNLSGSPSRLMLPHDTLAVARRHFVLQNAIVWVTSVHVGGKTHGHFKPINSERFLNRTHEYVFHLTPNGTTRIDRKAVGVEYVDHSNLRPWKSATRKRCNGSVWFIPYSTKQSSSAHPAMFPVELAERCVKLHRVDRAWLVFDPFSGVGTTALAAMRLGLNATCVELDRAYHRVAISRLHDVHSLVHGSAQG